MHTKAHRIKQVILSVVCAVGTLSFCKGLCFITYSCRVSAIGVLADDLATPEFEEIAAAHFDLVPVRRRPIQEPLGAATVASDPVAVVAPVDIGDSRKSAL
jgi:hypothetical protein